MTLNAECPHGVRPVHKCLDCCHKFWTSRSRRYPDRVPLAHDLYNAFVGAVVRRELPGRYLNNLGINDYATKASSALMSLRHVGAVVSDETRYLFVVDHPTLFDVTHDCSQHSSDRWDDGGLRPRGIHVNHCYEYRKKLAAQYIDDYIQVQPDQVYFTNLRDLREARA